MPDFTPEERLLLEYIGYYSTDPSQIEPKAELNFRELRLTGWNERDEKNLLSNFWGIYTGSLKGYGVELNFESRFIFYWQVFAILTFALRRPIDEDEAFLIRRWYEGYLNRVPGLPSDYYTYYDGDKVYRDYAIFLDPTKAISDNPIILRVSGNLNSQGQLQLPTVELEITKPREIPQFPQWDDKIINRFHRSTDPEMQEYTKAIGDWSALMHNAISQLA